MKGEGVYAVRVTASPHAAITPPKHMLPVSFVKEKAW